MKFNYPFNIIESPEKRYYGLDIIRAFSVILVMHMHFLQHFSSPMGINYFLLPFPDPVDLFFVCSGFLIGYQFLKNIQNNEVDKKFTLRFLIMRWMRTFPAYYVMLVFLISLNFLATKQFHLHWRNFFFIQNLYNNNSLFFRETWSISVEEWFYLLFPILFILFNYIFKLNQKKAYLFVLLFLIFTSLFLKTYYYFFVFIKHDFKTWGNMFREIVVLRLDTIAIGLLAAYICFYKQTLWQKYKWSSLIIGSTIYILSIFYYWLWSNKIIQNEFSAFYHFVLYYLVSPIGLALCFPFLKTIKFKDTLLNKIILFTSITSYSIYLIHGSFLLMIFIVLYHTKVCTNIIIIYLSWISLTLILSNFLYRIIELPFMNKRKWLVDKLGLSK